MADDGQTKIMVFGTFDHLHPGHLNFFKQARKLARRPYLIVSVAKSANVKKFKGQRPKQSERERLLAIKACPLVDKVVMGGLNQHLPHILKAAPAVIALGYDQRFYLKNLQRDLLKLGLKVRIIRLKAHRANIYKSSLLKKRSQLS